MNLNKNEIINDLYALIKDQGLASIAGIYSGPCTDCESFTPSGAEKMLFLQYDGDQTLNLEPDEDTSAIEVAETYLKEGSIEITYSDICEQLARRILEEMMKITPEAEYLGDNQSSNILSMHRVRSRMAATTNRGTPNVIVTSPRFYHDIVSNLTQASVVIDPNSLLGKPIFINSSENFAYLVYRGSTEVDVGMGLRLINVETEDGKLIVHYRIAKNKNATGYFQKVMLGFRGN